MLQAGIEIGHIDEHAPVPECLLPAGVPADRAFRHEIGVGLECAYDEPELLDEAWVRDAAPNARMQPRARHAEFLRERIAPSVFVLERLVEILPLRDGDRGAGAQEIEHILAADTV